MDLSQFLIMEQSPFRLWCCPRRCACVTPLPAVVVPIGRPSSKPMTCHSMPHPCRPRAGMAVAVGQEPSLPQCLLQPRWGWHEGASRHVKCPRRLLAVSPQRCPHCYNRNRATCTKPKAFHTEICSFLPLRPL